MAQGLTGFAGGRPEPQPVVRLFSFLVDKSEVPVRVRIGAETIEIPTPEAADARAQTQAFREPPSALPGGPTVCVPLIALAHGRSGDKGDIANIGIVARRPEVAPALRAGLTAERVRDYFAHYVRGPIERFNWPGLNGFNFVLHEALGGGGVASLRHDPQGKALAQALMDIPITVPAAWLDEGGPLAGWTEIVDSPCEGSVAR